MTKTEQMFIKHIEDLSAITRTEAKEISFFTKRKSNMTMLSLAAPMARPTTMKTARIKK